MSNDELLNELEADGADVKVDLAEVRALAAKQLQLEADVASAEARLDKAKKDLRKVQERELPAALKAAGMKSFELENGQTVSYKEDLKVSVPKARLAAVVEKMVEWGHADSVSNTLTIDVGRGNDNASKFIKAQAEEMGLDVEVAETVSTATVKSVLNARRKEGKNDDLGFFGAFEFTKATIK